MVKQGNKRPCHLASFKPTPRLYRCNDWLYPDPADPPNCKYDLCFELDHSSGHAAESKDGLSTTVSVLNSSWGGKQRFMRKSKLTDNDLGKVEHDKNQK